MLNIVSFVAHVELHGGHNVLDILISLEIVHSHPGVLSHQVFAHTRQLSHIVRYFLSFLGEKLILVDDILDGGDG